MNYHNITKDDMLNGDGLRTVLWVAGCSHHCPECQNPITWDANGGILFDEAAKQELFTELEKDYVAGITFSGGDPLNEANVETLLSLAKEIKEKFPNKTMWIYSGYTWEEIKGAFEESKKCLQAKWKNSAIARWELVSICDVFCDGRYVKECRDVNKPWVGSDNQRVIDVQKSLNEGTICLHGETKEELERE